MRHFLTSFCFVIILVCASSCTTDNDDHIQDMSTLVIGVWEQDGFLIDSGHRLVFAPDYSGLKIFRTTNGEQVTSTLTSVLWSIDGNVITISDEDSEVIGIYSLNAEGLLISEDIDELSYSKISDSTLDYY